MTCKDCKKYKECVINPAEDEFICNDFKAKKRFDWKKILKYVGISVGAGLVTGFATYEAYQKGKTKGHEEAYTSPEMQLIKDVVAYDAIDEYSNNLLKLAENGDFATEFTFEETGEKKYLTYTVSNEAPEWWNGENTQHFDLKEELLKED